VNHPHSPVLLDEVCEIFEGSHLTTFIDGTVGAGGHAEMLLKNHPEIKHFFAFDQDPQALELAKLRLDPWKDKVTFIYDNFARFDAHVSSFDGMLLDLGVSSMQLDLPEKGFSFSKEGPLDMRMNPSQSLTAKEICNTWSEQDLARIFRDYGEEKRYKKAAFIICRARDREPIETTIQLKKLLEPHLYDKKKAINPVTLVFQALRIAVNNELGVVETVLPKALNALNPKGRLAIITFHSLEDRLVKQAFRQAASDKVNTRGLGGVFLEKEPLVVDLVKRPIVALDSEIAKNPRSRSAKLRAVEKKGI
jgi:16S rRNA (cytosine1402-N4)-methyltransferase